MAKRLMLDTKTSLRCVVCDKFTFGSTHHLSDGKYVPLCRHCHQVLHRDVSVYGKLPTPRLQAKARSKISVEAREIEEKIRFFSNSQRLHGGEAQRNKYKGECQ